MRAICWLVVAGCGGAAVPPPVANSPTPAAKPAANDDTDELLHGHPTADRFDAFVGRFPSLSAARRSTIALLGTSADEPIHVPAIKYEYVWVEKIACNGGTGRVTVQALTGNASGAMLDRLSFRCPDDANDHAAYFDFSDDPDEKQMQQELGSGR